MTSKRAVGGGATGKWPTKIQLLLNNNRLREQRFSKAEVAALWQKAITTARDASLPKLSIESAIRLGYDAGHAAALAFLAARGLRTGGGHGHHEMAFYGAAAFGDPGLSDLVADSEEIRGLRHGSMYDPTIAKAKDRKDAIAWMKNAIPALHAALVAFDPSFPGQLPTIPETPPTQLSS